MVFPVESTVKRVLELRGRNSWSWHPSLFKSRLGCKFESTNHGISLSSSLRRWVKGNGHLPLCDNDNKSLSLSLRKIPQCTTKQKISQNVIKTNHLLFSIYSQNETCAFLVEHNVNINAGIDERHMKILNGHLLPPSGRLLNWSVCHGRIKKIKMDTFSRQTWWNLSWTTGGPRHRGWESLS